MKTIILVRYEEIFLKGLNKPAFEAKLVKNMKQVLKGLGPVNITRSQSRIYVEPEAEDYPVDEAIMRLTKVFGIASVSPVHKIETNLETIYEKAVDMTREITAKTGYKTFKVETKRANKKFPLKSMEVSRELGAVLLRNIPVLKVDVNNPDFIVYVEIRDYTYIYSEIVPAVKGLPVGSNAGLLSFCQEG